MIVKDNNIISDNYTLVNPKHADTADKLAVQRKLWGLNFDGTTDIDGNIVIKKPDNLDTTGITINASDNTFRANILYTGNIPADGASLNISSFNKINLLPGYGNPAASAYVNGNKIATEVDLNKKVDKRISTFGWAFECVTFNVGSDKGVMSLEIQSEGHSSNAVVCHVIINWPYSNATVKPFPTITFENKTKAQTNEYEIRLYRVDNQNFKLWFLNKTVNNRVAVCGITVFNCTSNYVLLNTIPVYDHFPEGILGTDYIIAEEHNVLPNVTDTLAYGIEWDTTISDPHCTRIGNSLLHKQLPIQSAYRGCVVKNGVLQYYLNPNDWAYKEDGTPSVLDGTDGDVMVHTPRFYGKSEIAGNKRRVWISTMQIDSSWTEVPELYVSAYRNTVHNINDNGVTKTLAASVVNTTAEYRGGNGADGGNDSLLNTEPSKTNLGKPRTSIPRATMRLFAINAGLELLSYELYKWIFYWAYVIEYANFNSQETFNSNLTSDGYHQGGLGAGVTYGFDWNGWANYSGNQPMTPCGYCNSIGNFTGTKTLSLPSVSVTYDIPRWRGFDNPFGDIWTNLDGIVIDTLAAGATGASIQPTAYIVYTTDKYTDSLDTIKTNFDKKVTFCHTSNWINEFVLDSNAEIIPETSGGSANANTNKCDYFWIDYNNTENTLYVGGGVANGSFSGLCAFDARDGVGRANSAVGFRTVMRI